MAKLSGLRLGALALCSTLAIAAGSTGAFAGGKLTGDLSYSYNSHFVSYGADVWGGGSKIFGDRSTNFFNGDLYFAVTPELSLMGNVWVEDNDNQATETLGGNITEIDTNFGATYTLGKVALSAMYGIWHYGGTTEDILDLSVALNDADMLVKGFALNPKLLWHDRVAKAASQVDEGSALLLSIGPSFTLIKSESYPLSLSIPAGVAFFLDDDFQGGSKDGYAYSWGGLSLSLPLAFIPSDYGTWSVFTDWIAYFTEHNAIPGNPKEDFVTADFGIKVAW